MPDVGPFDGLLYDPTRVGDLLTVTAPPYDVILPEERRRLHRASPYNISLVDLGEERGALADQYTRAAELLSRWREEGVLRRVGRPAVYPYEMGFVHDGEARRLRGVVLEVALEPWGGAILPHERTLEAPVEDRLALARATRANISPIYAVVPDPRGPQHDLLERAGARPADREVSDEEGVVHRLWVEEPGPDLAAWYRDRRLMVADGHHRYETALRLRDELHPERGPGPWDATMMLVVEEAEDPPILPIHRVVRCDGAERIPGRRVRDLAEVLGWLRPGGLRFGAAYLEDGDVVHLAGSLGGPPPAVAALHREVIDRLEGVRELRYLPDAVAAEEAVVGGAADVALFLPPARVDEVRAVVEGGGRLPEKSTYFWPKPRTGMVIRAFE